MGCCIAGEGAWISCGHLASALTTAVRSMPVRDYKGLDFHLEDYNSYNLLECDSCINAVDVALRQTKRNFAQKESLILINQSAFTWDIGTLILYAPRNN